MTLTRLEILRLVRTHRWLALFGVYLFFGVLGPVSATYIDELVARFGGGVEVSLPDPTPVDGIAQFVSNSAQLGILAVILVAAGALTMDARPEVSAFLRTRVPQPARLVLPRYGVATIAAVLSLCAGTLTAWAVTRVLLGPLPLGALTVGTLYGGLYLAFTVAVVAAVAGFVRGTAATVVTAIVVVIALPVLSLLAAVSPWLPSKLVGAVTAMAAGAPAGEYTRAVAVTVAAIPALVWLAIVRAGARDL